MNYIVKTKLPQNDSLSIMNFIGTKCIFLLMFFIQLMVLGQNIVINEFVSSNNSIIQDIDGDYSDWIELYNQSDSDINLADYTLSDNQNTIDKWVFL